MFEFYIDYSKVFWRPKILELYGTRGKDQILDLQYELSHEKNLLIAYGDNKDADELFGNRTADLRFVFATQYNPSTC